VVGVGWLVGGEETPLELAGEGHSSRLVSLLDNNNKTSQYKKQK
jgi:hypothetical protein